MKVKIDSNLVKFALGNFAYGVTTGSGLMLGIADKDTVPLISGSIGILIWFILFAVVVRKIHREVKYDSTKRE